jgi:two-component system CheB/CheR fusion protein
VAGDTALEELLQHLKTTRGFDFTGYKRPSLERRISKRLDAVKVDSYAAYLDYLEVHPEEFSDLFNTVLINVTGFFRDAAAWDYVRDEVIPTILASKPTGPIRVWCAGCSSGEETYTTAMLLAEAMGAAAYLERVKIYATDIDEDALDVGREATFTPKQVEDIPAELLERYFTPSDTRYSFRKDLRRTVIFGRNDLAQDAPISRVDLLVCRNVLMYFNADTQGRILGRFHFALNPGGFLFVGRSEMLLTRSDLFRPAGPKRRIFTKVLTPTPREQRTRAGDSSAEPAATQDLNKGAFEASAVPQIVVDRNGTLAMANEQARKLFGLAAMQLGKPLNDLELSYRPVELRSHLDRVWSSGAAAAIEGAVVPRSSGEELTVDVKITPVRVGGEVRAAAVVYADVTDRQRLQEDLGRSKRELETAYAQLQSTVEELETTNEELQSTNEELETTNEELQSTNEELETMNEELQSTNEELEAINDELRVRSRELNDVNRFLETILSSQAVAVAVVDRSQKVIVWNGLAEDLWGLRASEAEGEHFLNLDIGLPLETLRPALRERLNGAEDAATTVLDATDRRGHAFRCEVTMLPAGGPGSDGGASVILLMKRVEDAS